MSASKFYYYADFSNGSETVRSVPVLGIHVGDNDSEPWHSGDITSGIQFTNVFERIHQQAPAFLAIPQVFSMLVPNGREWERISITGFEPKPGMGIMSGPTINLTLRGAKVIGKTIVNGGSVPRQPPVQHQELVRKWGVGALATVIEVGLSVSDAAEVTI